MQSNSSVLLFVLFNLSPNISGICVADVFMCFGFIKVKKMSDMPPNSGLQHPLSEYHDIFYDIYIFIEKCMQKMYYAKTSSCVTACFLQKIQHTIINEHGMDISLKPDNEEFGVRGS